MHLMTNDDVERRLANGEDPIALTVEHWEENLAWILAGRELPTSSHGAESCPLCRSSDDCKNCPLGERFGSCIDSPDNAWHHFHYATDDERAIRAIGELLWQLHCLEEK